MPTDSDVGAGGSGANADRGTAFDACRRASGADEAYDSNGAGASNCDCDAEDVDEPGVRGDSIVVSGVNGSRGDVRKD